jgi:hypothetical protein
MDNDTRNLFVDRVQDATAEAVRPEENWAANVAGSLADIPEEDYQAFLDCCRAVRNGEPIPEAGATIAVGDAK